MAHLEIQGGALAAGVAGGTAHSAAGGGGAGAPQSSGGAVASPQAAVGLGAGGVIPATGGSGGGGGEGVFPTNLVTPAQFSIAAAMDPNIVRQLVRAAQIPVLATDSDEYLQVDTFVLISMEETMQNAVQVKAGAASWAET